MSRTRAPACRREIIEFKTRFFCAYLEIIIIISFFFRFETVFNVNASKADESASARYPTATGTTRACTYVYIIVRAPLLCRVYCLFNFFFLSFSPFYLGKTFTLARFAHTERSNWRGRGTATAFKRRHSTYTTFLLYIGGDRVPDTVIRSSCFLRGATSSVHAVHSIPPRPTAETAWQQRKE